MIWFYVAVAALVSFVVASVSVGGVTASLAGRSRRSVYDLDEAVEFVADRLPSEVTARIGYDDVRAVLGWHLELLSERGVASYKTADDPGSGLIVVNEDEPVAYVLGRVDATDDDQPGGSLTDTDVTLILAAETEYQASIGAIGHQVAGPADPG